MIGPLTNHLWQSTVFALAAALFTLLLRRNRAGVRYWIWLAASVKFLVPFSVLMALGALVPLWPSQPAAAPAAPAAFTVAVDQIAQPFADTFRAADSPPRPVADWGPIVFGAWVLVSAAIVFVRMRCWRAIRHAVRGSAPLTLPVGTTALDVRSAPGLLEPGVVGVWRPILLLPERIADCLTRDQLETVVVHEQCHIQRRDNLTAAVHMIVETVFWFHPFVWWIGARLVAERERACDEAVLDRGLPPRDYADAILNVCRLYVESPLACVAGVTGSNLRKRIDDIMISRTGVSLSAGRKTLLLLASLTAVLLPLAIGAVTAPLRAQATSTAPTSRRTFDVVSIKPCKGDDLPSDGRGAGPGGIGLSPGRLHIDCLPLVGRPSLMRQAYAVHATGRLAEVWVDLPIEGGPAWTRSDRFTIEAKTEGTPSADMMHGPMLQALLEQQFHLKTHRETRQIPVYELSVANGGPKLRPFDGHCTPVDSTKGDLGAQLEAKDSCPISVAGTKVDATGETIDDFIRFVLTFMDRPVLNKTGLSGRFDIHLDLPPDLEKADIPSALAVAVQQQLGLKISPAKGPGDTLVIDHVERPDAGR